MLQRYGRHVLIVQASEQLQRVLESSEEVQGAFTGPVPEHHISRLDLSESLGVSAWNERHTSRFTDAKVNRPGAGLSWGDPEFDQEG